MDEKQWIKVPEAAKLLKVSRATMYRMVDKLAAEGVQIYKPSAKVTWIDAASLEAWAARQRLGGGRGGKLLNE